jgi:nucleotide-binding universal stress UspA family protein
MAERRVLTDDVRMVWIADPPHAAPHSEWVPQDYELVGVEQTVVCGLDVNSQDGPIGFAAWLARRLGWRLSLVPWPEAATDDERLDRLLAASTRDRAGLVITEAGRNGASGAGLIKLSRGAACPLIAVPRGTRALGAGPILCGIASRGSSGATASAASRLASAIGAPLRLVYMVSHDEGEPTERLGELARREDAALLAVGAPSGDSATPDGTVAAVLRDSQAPVMVVPGGAGVARASEAA